MPGKPSFGLQAPVRPPPLVGLEELPLAAAGLPDPRLDRLLGELEEDPLAPDLEAGTHVGLPAGQPHPLVLGEVRRARRSRRATRSG